MTIPFNSHVCEREEEVNMNKMIEKYKSVPLWTVSDVCSWPDMQGFSQLVERLEDEKVDGDLLLQLTEDDLVKDLCITNGILRKRLLRSLKKVKIAADYSCFKGGYETSEFLSDISEDLIQYTYNLVTRGLEPRFMEKLNSDDLEDILKDSGVVNSVHRQKIKDEISVRKYDEIRCIPRNMSVNIIYNKSEANFGSLVKIYLELRGVHVLENASLQNMPCVVLVPHSEMQVTTSTLAL